MVDIDMKKILRNNIDIYVKNRFSISTIHCMLNSMWFRRGCDMIKIHCLFIFAHQPQISPLNLYTKPLINNYFQLIIFFFFVTIRRGSISRRKIKFLSDAITLLANRSRPKAQCLNTDDTEWNSAEQYHGAMKWITWNRGVEHVRTHTGTVSMHIVHTDTQNRLSQCHILEGNCVKSQWHIGYRARSGLVSSAIGYQSDFPFARVSVCVCWATTVWKCLAFTHDAWRVGAIPLTFYSLCMSMPKPCTFIRAFVYT